MPAGQDRQVGKQVQFVGCSPASTASTSATLPTPRHVSPGTRSCPGASWPAPIADTWVAGQAREGGRSGAGQAQRNRQHAALVCRRRVGEALQLAAPGGTGAEQSGTGTCERSMAHVELGCLSALARQQVAQGLVIHLQHAAAGGGELFLSHYN